MSTFGLLRQLGTLIPKIPINDITSYSFQQIRNKYVGCRMIRDVKRRRMNAEAYYDRLRLNAMKRNTVLPPEITEMAAKELAAFPLNATPLRMNKRCVLTSRPRGVVYDWRLSRIVWRSLADYNKLSGVQRAMWGFTGRNTFFTNK